MRPASTSCAADAVEVRRAGVDLDEAVAHADVFSAGVDGDEGDLVGVRVFGFEADEALVVELPGDAAGLAEGAAAAGERGAELGDGAVAVVGEGLDEDGDAARAVALERDLLESVRVAAAGAALDRALDGVGGHVLVAGLVDGEAEAGVHGGVAAAFARGDGDLAREPGEDLAALGVIAALLALDLSTNESDHPSGLVYQVSGVRCEVELDECHW